MARRLSAATLRRGMNLWPPFLFAGIRVLHLADDWSSARVRLRLGRFNRNYFGTHFGGSLFSMTDPFWALMVVSALGRDYIVWDKASEIDFVAPGRGDVFADFVLDPGRLAEIKAATADGAKALPWFTCTVTAEDGSTVAEVRKQLYVRRKPARREAGSDGVRPPAPARR
ncbi:MULTISPECIES: DUF4442 domain-containing protein [unclassified Streptomyces]|uniref:DUF4442 domain-containing protein n=1 Tax=unclassified Streptomyces TaxID=2593676 RepID=UPI0022B687D6|nr:MULTISPECIES: DUF4442 domain-containing protein [unclassified Streptomyces]MCZ7415601.1 DUF4442 domain-containing protein [Streptomyces sp. WMMC897]MCZ7434587.1 DUF4442 domain-containing protein [Streptomyces sp. WMMC1477]